MISIANVIRQHLNYNVLIAIVLVVFLGPFGGNMILPMFRSLKISYGVDILWVGLGITAYMIPFSFFQLFSGALSDAVYGRKKIIVFGMLLYALGSLGVASSPNIFLFLVFRAIQGTGNAFAFPIAMTLVGDYFPGSMRGKVMGLASISSTLGITLGPLFGGLISSVNWRLGFIALAIMAVISTIYLHSALRHEEIHKDSEAFGNAMKMFKVAIMDLRVIFLSFTGFMLFFTRIGFITYLSDTLTLPPYEYSNETIAGYLSLAGFGGLVAGGIAGYLADKFGRKKTLTMGLVTLPPILSVYVTNMWSNYLGLLLFLQGFFGTMAFTALNTMIVEVSSMYRATATSIYGSLRFFGYALGPALLYVTYKHGFLSGVAIVCATLILATFLTIIMVFLKQKYRSKRFYNRNQFFTRS